MERLVGLKELISVKYRTKRLVVRKILKSDVTHLLEMNNNPKVMKYIATAGFNPTSATIEMASIVKQKKYYKKHADFGMWMIQFGSKTIGWISLKYNSDLKNYELGYRLKESAWGNGYITEACFGLIEYVRKIRVKEFKAIAMNGNKSSVNIMKKIGMTYSDTAKMYNEDVVVYKYTLTEQE